MSIHLALSLLHRCSPRYSSNRLFIIGESYAGLYVPMLAQQVIEAGTMRLEGIAVGDGCLGGGDARLNRAAEHMRAAQRESMLCVRSISRSLKRIRGQRGRVRPQCRALLHRRVFPWPWPATTSQRLKRQQPLFRSFSGQDKSKCTEMYRVSPFKYSFS